MFWLFAVKAPPKVKALMVSVPELACNVPPARKLSLLPPPREISPAETERPLAAWMPKLEFKEPEKVLEPVLLDIKVPLRVTLPPMDA